MSTSSRSPQPLHSPTKVPGVRVTPEPAHHPEEYHDQDEDDDYPPYPEPSDSAPLLPPPNFNPFFTIIEDSSTGEHHHPYVHYVFSDDDQSIVTAAAMRSLGLDDTEYLPSEGAADPEGEHRTEAAAPAESPLPPPIPGIEERYIVVDIARDGHTVLNAQSMSPEWQVTQASVRAAPAVPQLGPDVEDKDNSFMLKIDGVGIPGRKKIKGKGKASLARRPGEALFEAEREKAGGDAFKAMQNLLDQVDSGVAAAKGFGLHKGESTIRVDDMAGED